MYLVQTGKRGRRSWCNHPHDANVASKSPRTSLTGKNTQRVETKTLATEMQKEEMQSWGMGLLFKGRQPLGIPNAQPRRYWNDMLPGNSQGRRLAINALPPFRLRTATWHDKRKKQPKFQNHHFFLTRPFCPGKIARLKGGHCRDPPLSPRGTRGMLALSGAPRGAHDTLKYYTWTVLYSIQIHCPDHWP